MFVLTLKWNKKTAVLLIAAVALLLAVIVIAVGRGGGAEEDAAAGIRLDSCEKRVAYLAALGWVVDPASETAQDIVIPREFSPVYEKYNELQKAQGFDLSAYCGLDARIYGYAVTNHPNGEGVIAQIILISGQVVGGDVHSTALGGFMHGLKPQPD